MPTAPTGTLPIAPTLTRLPPFPIAKPVIEWSPSVRL
jgi:hypothetical protein